jgi:hypothetical protein
MANCASSPEARGSSRPDYLLAVLLLEFGRSGDPREERVAPVFGEHLEGVLELGIGWRPVEEQPVTHRWEVPTRGLTLV